MVIPCTGCGGSSQGDTKSSESKTEAVKAEEATTQAPEVAATEASLSGDDLKIIENFWEQKGMIVHLYNTSDSS